jgi:hypothetical protein
MRIGNVDVRPRGALQAASGMILVSVLLSVVLIVRLNLLLR